MDQAKHKFNVEVCRIRFNSWGEEIGKSVQNETTWAKSEAKAISNVKFRLYGKAMNSVFPEEEIFYKATAIV